MPSVFLRLLIITPLYLMLSCDYSRELRFPEDVWVKEPPVSKLAIGSISVDTISFEPPITGDHLSFQVVHEQNHVHLIGLVAEEDRLDFYSLDRKTYTKSIQFETDGPNGVKGMIDGFYYHNADSIFLLSSDANMVFLMNKQAQKINTYRFRNNPLPDGFADYDVYASNGTRNGPVYVPSSKSLQLYTYRWYPQVDDYLEHEVFANFSISDGSFKSIYGINPDEYVKNKYYSFYEDPSLIVDDTLSFVQYGLAANLSAYNNKTGELLYATKYVNKHWSGSPMPMPLNSSSQFRREWLIQAPSFPGIVNDPENKRIYRFQKHEKELLDGDGLLNNLWEGKWSLSVFDYKLRRIGDFDLPELNFFPLYSFVAFGDLWIYNNSDRDEEDIVLFYRIKFKKKK